MVEPARLAGLRLEPGLVELAVREVAGEPGALPLLSHALRATWERRDGRTLTVEAYRESGGVGAAVAQTADELLGGRCPPSSGGWCATCSCGSPTSARTAPQRGGASAIEELVPEGVSPEDGAGAARAARRRPAADAGRGHRRGGHEMLIREWPTLRGWLEEDREGIRLHRQLGDAAGMWEAGGREPSDLYRGTD